MHQNSHGLETGPPATGIGREASLTSFKPHTELPEVVSRERRLVRICLAMVSPV